MQANDLEDELVDAVRQCAGDPLKFVLMAFDWGQDELEKEEGPDAWQAEVLGKIRDGLLTPSEAVMIATASGHGIGKSALVAWIVLWAVSTVVDTRGVVTANTDTQLETKTWAELAKWYRHCITKHWFRFTTTAIVSALPAHEKTWRIDKVPWSERNTEAFAGLHNKGKRVLMIFDEASAIPPIIWEVAEGALTDEKTELIWCVFGNPTRNTGRFRECFGKFKHRWVTQQIDSRTARMTNKDQLHKWVADYGEDSDFVRVRVRGVFPKAGDMQFIPSDIVEHAAKREDAHTNLSDAFVMGVDVARFGDDESVIYFRKGPDGRTHKPLKFRGLDTMQLAARVADQARFYRADAIFIDGGGPGGGVVDRLRQLNVSCIEIQFGSSADRSQPGQEDIVYANKRAEMFGNMREWLKQRGTIDDDIDLKSQLEGVQYGYVMREGRDAILLEKKEDMKKRGLSSPDIADALALTFAYPVEATNTAGRFAAGSRDTNVTTEYDPFNEPVRDQVVREYQPIQ